MKRILTSLLILLLGIGIGYVLNHLIHGSSKNPVKTQEVIVSQIKKQIIKDTIIVERIVNTSPSEIADSTEDNSENYSDNDSTTVNVNQREVDTAPGKDEADEVIIQEKMVGQRVSRLIPVATDSTDVEAMLGVKTNAFSKEITIEFWQSPLNLTGYVLTRNKLKLFGFNPNETISLRLSKDNDHLFLNTETLSILLEKSDQFKYLTLK